MNGALTKSERTDLLRVARLRTKVARTAVEQRAAELMADFERQLASIYHFDQDATWRAAYRKAQEVVEEARSKIADRCAELGIPKEFAPGLDLGWYGRGGNASASRRAELRKVAVTRIEAKKREAYAQIERHSAEIQTELLAIGMSADARRLLDSMPTAATLLPTLTVSEAELLLLEQRRSR